MELYATAVYTGMRAGELLGLRWAEVDLEKRRITVTRSYDKPPKSGKSRIVPILDPLLPVLSQWKLQSQGDTVFPGASGNRQGPSARVLQEVLKRCLKRAGLVPTEGETSAPYARITFHDLWHTFASHWVMNGGDIYRLQKVLGHKRITMTERYAKLAPEIFKQDWGRMPDMVPRWDGDSVRAVNTPNR